MIFWGGGILDLLKAYKTKLDFILNLFESENGIIVGAIKDFS